MGKGHNHRYQLMRHGRALMDQCMCPRNKEMANKLLIDCSVAKGLQPLHYFGEVWVC